LSDISELSIPPSATGDHNRGQHHCKKSQVGSLSYTTQPADIGFIVHHLSDLLFSAGTELPFAQQNRPANSAEPFS
jgi:hypothetical protein